MKVAFPTEDGQTISAHLGRAPFYIVAEYEGEEAAHLEQRGKTFHGEEQQHEGESHMSHAQAMFQPVADCQVIISGGMGQPAYEQAVSQGFQVILTGEKSISSGLQAFREGKLTSDSRRIHIHR